MDEHAPRRIGKYRIIAKLGQGGMASVYLGLTSGMGKFKKLVVVKVLHPKFANNPEFIEMFMSEARLAARLNHPNIVQTFEVGRDENYAFIQMEYLEGQPLHYALKRIGRKKFKLELYVRILIDVLAALHHAHELTDFDGSPLGVVHRDVSPQNIFITYDGVVKLVDFGVAKAACSDQETRAGIMKGKIAYLAPEQATGAIVDRRADLFAVGVLLWEALARRRFASGSLDVATIHNRVTGAEPRIRDVVPDAPSDLADICDKALALKPENRYQTGAEFKEALELALESRRERSKASLLGEVISEAFVDERTTIQSLIVEHTQVESVPPADYLDGTGTNTLPEIARPAFISTSGVSSPGSISSPGSYTGNSPMLASTGAQIVPSDAPGKRTGLYVAAATAVAVLAIGALAVTTLTHKSQQQVSAAPPATLSGSTPTDTKGATAELLVMASPPSAHIFVDDVRTDANPFRAKVPKDSTMHKVRVEAEGFESQVRAVSYDGNQTVKITLKAVKKQDNEEQPKRTARRHVLRRAPAAPAETATATAAPTPAPAKPALTAGANLRPANRNTPTHNIDDKDPYAQ